MSKCECNVTVNVNLGSKSPEIVYAHATPREEPTGFLDELFRINTHDATVVLDNGRSAEAAGYSADNAIKNAIEKATSKRWWE